MDQTCVDVLLSKVLLQYTRDWEEDGVGPSLLFWSNFLRPVGTAGIQLREAHRAARVSRRAIRPTLQNSRLFVIDGDPHTVRLTREGRAALDEGTKRLEIIDAAWRERFGATRVDDLTRALEDFVRQLPLELPHYPMGYGPADSRVTGGNAVQAKDGPVPIPAHGTEWPVVRRARTDGDSTTGLPMSALLSQTLVAFRIDEEANTTEDIEAGWRRRYGTGTVKALRASLTAVAKKTDPDLPNQLLVRFFGGRGFIVVSAT